MSSDELYDEKVTIPAAECAHLADFSKARDRLIQAGMSKDAVDDYIEHIPDGIYGLVKDALRELHEHGNELYAAMVDSPAAEFAELVDLGKIRAQLIQAGMGENAADRHIRHMRDCIYEWLKDELLETYEQEQRRQKTQREAQRRAALERLASANPELAELLKENRD